MTFWIIATLLMLLTVTWLLLPLLRGGGGAVLDPVAYDLEVYKDQMAEIEAERERGGIDAQEAEAARTEIARRILGADDRRRADGDLKPALTGRIAAVAIALLVPAGAIVLYAQLGKPGLPAAPFAERAQQAGGDRTGDLQASAVRLQRRLAADPANLEGWRMLARTYMQLRRFDGAAKSYEKALGLDAGNAALKSAYGEALMFAAGGTVTPASRAAFESVLEALPKDHRARFYLAIADEQAGKRREALGRWVALLNDAPPEARWARLGRERAVATAKALGLDPEKVLPAAGAAPGPSKSDIEAAKSQTPEERQAMIEAMVQQLADRLKEQPENLAGWLRLARAYMVLKRYDDAGAALAKASALDDDNVDILMLHARAIRSAAGNQQTAESVAVMRRVLALAPTNMEALWLVGNAELQAGKREAGLKMMQRALDQLPADARGRADLERHLENLRATAK